MNMVHTAEATSRRARKRLDQTRRMLDHAERVIADRGVEGLTMARLAGDLDLAVGTLYRYFPSKESLVAAVHRRVVKALRDRHAELQTTLETADAAEHALAAAEHALSPILLSAYFYMDLPRLMPERFRLVTWMLGDPRPFVDDEHVEQSVAELIGFISDVTTMIRAAMSQGALSSDGKADVGRIAMDRTVMLWGSVQGLLQFNKFDRFGDSSPAAKTFDSARLGPELCRGLLVGWGAESGALDLAHDIAAGCLSHFNASSEFVT